MCFCELKYRLRYNKQIGFEDENMNMYFDLCNRNIELHFHLINLLVFILVNNSGSYI